jgi:hypothetical protein
MARRIFLFWALLISLVVTEAQEGDPAEPSEPPEPETFPVSLLLEAAEAAGNGEPLWRPDWPMELPPDAFRFNRKEGEVPLLSVEVLVVPSDASFQRAYRFSRDRKGRVREFPFLLYREFFQAVFSYHDESSDGARDESFDDVNNRPLVAAVALKGPEGADPLNLEVLKQEDSRPSLIRVLWGEIYSFVSIVYRRDGILETWYDMEGRFLDVYDYIVTPQAGGDRIVSCMLRGSGREERYYYDSRGLVTKVSSPLGDFSVRYYREDLPRYWDYRPAVSGQEAPGLSVPGAYSFRWDETPHLSGFSGTPAEEGQDPVDCRYAYTLDEKGNWIERRETRLLSRVGLLVPSPGSTIIRILEYGEEEEEE